MRHRIILDFWGRVLKGVQKNFFAPIKKKKKKRGFLGTFLKGFVQKNFCTPKIPRGGCRLRTLKFGREKKKKKKEGVFGHFWGPSPDPQ